MAQLVAIPERSSELGLFIYLLCANLVGVAILSVSVQSSNSVLTSSQKGRLCWVLSAQTYDVESTDYLLPSTGTEIGLLCSREMCVSSLLNIAEWPSKMMCQLTHPPVFHKFLLLFSLFLNSLFCSSFIVLILAYHHTVSISMLPDWLHWFL